jgi:preprotein translocase subunit YajC
VKSSGYLFLILIVAVFYFLILRPQQRRQRAAQQVSKGLEPGQEVMTTAGLFGTVRSVTDDHVELEIAPGVVVRYVKAAIARVVPPPTVPDDASELEPGTSEPSDSSDETERGDTNGHEPGAQSPGSQG